MKRENDSYMDNHLREHLRRDTPADKATGGRSPQTCGGQLKHMTETPSSKGKGAPNRFYCPPTEAHAENQRLSGGKATRPFRLHDGVQTLRQTRHYEDECHIKGRKSEKLEKAEEECGKNAGKGGKPGAGSLTLGFQE